MAEDEPGSIYLVEGDRAVPTRFAQGPWDPNAQHGGAVCGLLTRALERLDCLAPMRFVRISFNLLRAIPLRPSHTTARVLREGKKIQLVEASLFDGETEVARATGQRIRLRPGLDTGANPPINEALPVSPGEGPVAAIPIERAPGFIQAVDFIRGDGEPDGVSQRTVWTRFKLPLVAGEPTSPLVLLAAMADFTSGTANGLDFSRYVSINPDVSLHIHRYPESEWIGLRGSTELQTDGTGQSEADLFDERGRVGRALTSLLVDRSG